MIKFKVFVRLKHLFQSQEAALFDIKIFLHPAVFVMSIVAISQNNCYFEKFKNIYFKYFEHSEDLFLSAQFNDVPFIF